MNQVSFDGHGWAISSEDGAMHELHCAEESLLPEVSGAVDCLFWPIERLLLRPFRLPLKHPRLLDAEIVGQELSEQTGENPESWWLAWQASSSGEGIAGMAFGLPNDVREAIDAVDAWRDMPALIVDATARLGAWLPEGYDGRMLAVFDMDADGLFIGLRQGDAWVGLRRLNGSREQRDDLAQEAGRSLAAMGWNAGEHDAVGRLAPEMIAMLGIERWHGPDCDGEHLPGRHQANLMLSAALPGTAVNLRHDRWAIRRRRSFGAGVWRRSVALAAVLLLLWISGSVIQLYRLSGQEGRYRQQVADAFHRGLPHETVMMDALAQLRKAAGGGSGDATVSGDWLRQLQAVGQVYQSQPWTLRELVFENGQVHMSGTVDGLGKLNGIRKALAGKLGRDVELADTDLHGQSVSFRMRW